MTEDLNCMSYWYPRIKGLVPTPQTELLVLSPEDGHDMARVLDGDSPQSIERVYRFVAEAAQRMGGYPVFLRTGHGSGKHNWDRTCRVARSKEIADHIHNLIEWSHLADMLGLPHNVWAVRRMLAVEPICCLPTYCGLPLVPEWRVFIRDHKVQCSHPYWPPRAVNIGLGKYSAATGAAILRYQAAPTPAEAILYAEDIGAVLAGYWSVDVLQAKDGLYVIDMAQGERSWHWDGCNAQQTSKERGCGSGG